MTNKIVYSILINVLRNNDTRYATVAQLVEYDLAKVGVAGSSPVCRSLKEQDILFLFCITRKKKEKRTGD